MRFKRPIYRYLFYAAWLVVLGGIVTLLVSANRESGNRICKGISISINNGGDRISIEKKDVLKNIEKAAGGTLLNKSYAGVNLGRLEASLESNSWIEDAELYFDSKDILHVTVGERVPVARVFTTTGSSYYLDSAGFALPLLESYSAKLPVITGFVPLKKGRKADSVLLIQTKEVVKTISADPFWNAQVGQIDITPERKFELIPVVGNHVIRLGKGENVAGKLDKLLVFYKQVLPKAGLAKYSALDLQFDGQIIAVKKGRTSIVDSLALQKNIAALLEKKKEEQEPVEALPIPTQAAPMSNGDFEVEPVTDNLKVDQVAKASGSTTENQSSPSKTTARPTLLKKTITSSPPVGKTTVVKKPKPKPKAVMPKRSENAY